MKIAIVKDAYINYLINTKKINCVYENKRTADSVRKYIGVVFVIDGYQYFAPMSSPKNTDYQTINGNLIIRKSIIPIIRLVDNTESNFSNKLKGTIRLSNMIPVPSSAIEDYILEKELNVNYKNLILNQIAIIRDIKKLILKNAKIIYQQRNRFNLYPSQQHPGYIKNTIDFKLCEIACNEYQTS